MLDHESIQRRLKTLLHEAYHLSIWHPDQTERFIAVREYALALDNIAYAYLVNNVVMPRNLAEIFEKLAASMQLENDPEYASVEKLRTIQSTRAQQ